MHAGAQVDDNEYRPLAFLAKQLRVGGGAARRDAPVDAAWIIAGLVRARFVELHSAPAKVRHIGTRLQRIDAQHIESDGACRAAQADQPGLADADR